MIYWVAYHGELEKLCREKDLTYAQLASDAGCSVGTIARVRDQERIRETTFRDIAAALEVPMARLGRPESIRRDDRALVGLIGLLDASPRVADDDVPFQDFDLFGPEFNNPIQHLWAHALGSTISAHVVKEEEQRMLRVEFDNKPGAHPGNVLLHPTHLIPRERMPSQRYLAFDVRDQTPRPEECDELPTPPISVAVRVRDEKLEQWEYRSHAGYCLPPLDGSEWQTLVVNLEFDSEHPNWQCFVPIAGERREMPDFRVITSVGFEFGRGQSRERPGIGQGVVDIKNICFRSDTGV